ncbi:MAG: hypothetical protein DRQ78_08350 [Epsilonproteobacteria bacterium]|nr:MAG: hypothetical protein DRQ78_08350 [Campylobacterota bacterium]
MSAYEEDYTVLIYGFSASGKSYSMRNLDLTRTAYINVELKPLTMSNASDLAAYYKPSTIEEVQQAISECAANTEIDTVIFDSITMLADKIMYPHFIEDAPLTKSGQPDKMTGWGNYKTFFNHMITFCKKSNKSFVFTALAMDTADEQDKFEKVISPKIQGSLKESISSEFTTVLYASAKLIEENGTKVGKYLFQTNREPNSWFVQAKSIPGCLDLYEPNDTNAIINKIKAFYKK